MSTGTLLDKIAASPRLTELLYWPWDFDVTAPTEDDWFVVKPQHRLQIIAKDGTGGVFALWGDEPGEDRPVLFISSEGQAGVIAATLSEALQMMISLPFWRDCLHFSGGGKLEEMQRAAAYLEKEIRGDEPDVGDYQEELFAGLGLGRDAKPLDILYQRLTEHHLKLSVTAEDGSVFDGLFGSFVVEDNPTWRVAARPA